MNTNEFRAALAALHLSQRSAARTVGVDERTTRRWAAGTDVPEPVARILRFLIRCRIPPEIFEHEST
jgi:DNA-binding transcriptional regulator YiaG